MSLRRHGVPRHPVGRVRGMRGIPESRAQAGSWGTESESTQRCAMGTAVLTTARGRPLRCASPSSGAYPIKPSTLAPRIKPCASTTRSAPASSPTLTSKRNSAARKAKVKSASARSALILGLLRFKDGPLGGRIIVSSIVAFPGRVWRWRNHIDLNRR